MTGISETTELALAVLRLADAIDEGSTNATARSDAVYRARKHAHAVLDRYRGGIPENSITIQVTGDERSAFLPDPNEL